MTASLGRQTSARFSMAGSFVRGAAIAAKDRVRPRDCRLHDDIPASLECITPGWLTEVLQREVAGSVVESVVVDATSKGTSVRGRLNLRYREQRCGQPATLFAKTASTFTTRVANGASGTASTEAGFYQHLRQRLSVEAPRNYHCAADHRSWRSIHIIEDLVETKGATFGTPKVVISAGHAEKMMEQLAVLHAEGTRMPEVSRQPPQWLRSYSEWWQRALLVGGVQRGHLRGVAAAVDAGVAQPALRGRGRELWQGFTRSVAAHRDLPKTLLHGDAHLGNWYTTADGEMGLCDWQCVSVGHWSRDLAYTLVSALDVDQRRAWERELIQLYLERLRELSATPVKFDSAWRAYRLQVLGALLMWTPVYRPPAFLPDMQPVEVVEEMLRRITTAVVDLESLAA